MLAALGWGTLAAASLVIGALLAFARDWHPPQVGLVLAFGSGALISAVSFELVDGGFSIGVGGSTAIGLALGAITYYGLDGLIARRFDVGRGRSGAGERLGRRSCPGPGRLPRRRPPAGRTWDRAGPRTGRQRRSAGGDIRFQPPRVDRLGDRHAKRRHGSDDDHPALADRGGDLRSRHRVGLRGLRSDVRRRPRRDRWV